MLISEGYKWSTALCCLLAEKLELPAACAYFTFVSKMIVGILYDYVQCHVGAISSHELYQTCALTICSYIFLMWMWCWRSYWAEARWYWALHRDRQGCVEVEQAYTTSIQHPRCLFRSRHIRQPQELVPLQGRGLVLHLSGAQHQLRCAKLLWSIRSLQQREVQVTELNFHCKRQPLHS